MQRIRYVKMAGQEEDGGEAPTDPSRGFSGKPLKHRAAIVAAGPVVNLVFAFVVMFAAYFAYGQLVPSNEARVGGVVAGSPADKGGLKTGEVVTSVDASPVAGWDDFSTRVRESGGRTLTVVLRDESGAEREVSVTPERAESRRIR